MHAQLAAMGRLWPQMQARRTDDGAGVIWIGAVRPRARVYEVAVIWSPAKIDRPYAMVLDPQIEPRPGGSHADIPHLMYDAEAPDRSGLCLFDPDGAEWSPADLIAETTMKWVCEWLLYYELWHATGEWLGASIGYESVSAMIGSRGTDSQ